MTLTRPWIADNLYDIEHRGFPRCRVCGGVLRLGSYVDEAWPWETDKCCHLSCLPGRKRPNVSNTEGLNNDSEL